MRYQPRNYFAFFVLALLMSACSPGCTSFKNANPSAVAQTGEQQAYALYGQFIIAEEAAATIAEDPATPQAAKESIAQADQAAKDVADDLLAASRQVLTIRSQISQGKSTEDKLTIALANLDKWVADAKPKIENLTKSLTGTKEPT